MLGRHRRDGREVLVFEGGEEVAGGRVDVDLVCKRWGSSVSRHGKNVGRREGRTAHVADREVRRVGRRRTPLSFEHLRDLPVSERNMKMRERPHRDPATRLVIMLDPLIRLLKVIRPRHPLLRMLPDIPHADEVIVAGAEDASAGGVEVGGRAGEAVGVH